MEPQLSSQHVHRVSRCRCILHLASGLLLLSAACRTNPEPRPVLAAIAALQHTMSYSADVEAPGLEDAPLITATFAALSRWPQSSTLASVESRAQLITVVPARTVVTPVAGLLRNARVGITQDETLFLSQAPGHPTGRPFVKELSGVLPHGVCASFRVRQKEDGALEAAPQIEVQIRRGAEPNAAWAVSLIMTAAPQDVPAAHLLTTETIQLTPLHLEEQDRLAMILPSPFGVEELKAFGVVIEMGPPPQRGTAAADRYARLVKECQDDLSAQAGGRAAPQAPNFEAGRRGLDEAIRLLQSPTYMRQALLYLAQEMRMPLTEDIALSAADRIVFRLARADSNECAPDAGREVEVLRARLEKAAYRLLAEAIAADPAPLELEAIAIRHAGEVGRHPSVLKEIVATAADPADLEQCLVQENLIYLEDISPAARTRAFEWLTAGRRAPAGYDPLAPSQERRRALNRALSPQP